MIREFCGSQNRPVSHCEPLSEPQENPYISMLCMLWLTLAH